MKTVRYEERVAVGEVGQFPLVSDVYTLLGTLPNGWRVTDVKVEFGRVEVRVRGEVMSDD